MWSKLKNICSCENTIKSVVQLHYNYLRVHHRTEMKIKKGKGCPCRIVDLLCFRTRQNIISSCNSVLHFTNGEAGWKMKWGLIASWLNIHFDMESVCWKAWLRKASPEDSMLIVGTVLLSKHLGDRRNVFIKMGLYMRMNSFAQFRESSLVKNATMWIPTC